MLDFDLISIFFQFIPNRTSLTVGFLQKMQKVADGSANVAVCAKGIYVPWQRLVLSSALLP
jgi:hypothetical protein